MANGQASLTDTGFGKTMRRDAWWVQPLFTFLGLSTFIVYSTWRAFHGQHFLAVDGGTNYLSPFFSPIVYFHDLPTLSADLKSALAAHAWLGTMPGWVPHWVSPAFFILWAPAGFRFTCYYYRGAYYKAFWADPINCSVSEPRNSYRGEHKFPLIFQNIHRYFFYVAAAFIFILSYDAWQGMWFAAEDGGRKFGLGIGSFVLWGNVIFLGGYTFGCHSFRHLIGGGINKLSKTPVRSKCYECVGCLNAKHMIWAWCSLVWVGFTDFYVWMCASGTWTDFRIL